MSNSINNMLNKLSELISSSKPSQIDNVLSNLGITKEEAIKKIQNIDQDELSKAINNISQEDLEKIKNINPDEISKMYNNMLDQKKE